MVVEREMRARIVEARKKERSGIDEQTTQSQRFVCCLPFGIVFALAAQIVDFVVPSVALLEELLHVFHVVAIQALRAFARETHRDDSVGENA